MGSPGELLGTPWAPIPWDHMGAHPRGGPPALGFLWGPALGFL